MLSALHLRTSTPRLQLSGPNNCARWSAPPLCPIGLGGDCRLPLQRFRCEREGLLASHFSPGVLRFQRLAQQVHALYAVGRATPDHRPRYLRTRVRLYFSRFPTESAAPSL